MDPFWWFAIGIAAFFAWLLLTDGDGITAMTNKKRKARRARRKQDEAVSTRLKREAEREAFLNRINPHRTIKRALKV